MESDTDGIYILVNGAVKVINKIDQSNGYKLA